MFGMFTVILEPRAKCQTITVKMFGMFTVILEPRAKCHTITVKMFGMFTVILEPRAKCHTITVKIGHPKIAVIILKFEQYGLAIQKICPKDAGRMATGVDAAQTCLSEYLGSITVDPTQTYLSENLGSITVDPA